MREIFVLVEHRQGHIRDVTFEMLSKGSELAEETNTELTGVLFGKNVKNLAKLIS
ncbi:MAG: electron transfer flavoprotein subunit alpha/FixB family protein, partial [Armatimonadetes bacterium]|nr:electron transfer flavoprotein subunit alpha/FixB family protein [Armatimonadota bacterium]